MTLWEASKIDASDQRSTLFMRLERHTGNWTEVQNSAAQGGWQLPQGGNGAYEPLFQYPGGGWGLFCQAIMGADGLHGTDRHGDQNQKKTKWHF